MKLIKAIRLHRKLRKRQEYLCYKVTQWSQMVVGNSDSPYLREYSVVNKAVRKLNRMLPGYYFFFSDVFGFAKSLKYIPGPNKRILKFEGELIAFDLVPNPGFSGASINNK